MMDFSKKSDPRSDPLNRTDPENLSIFNSSSSRNLLGPGSVGIRSYSIFDGFLEGFLR